MKRRVVVLGGGAGSLATVWELTNRPGWKDRFDITVLQMGHRLGGKGASSVNRAHHDRIEEHGLHLFWGFYENAFRMMREVYSELGRPPGAPLATVEDAFFPQDTIVIPEHSPEGEVTFWPLTLPRNQGRPGDGLDDVLEPLDVLPTLAARALESLGIGDFELGDRSWLARARPLVEAALSRGSETFEQLETLFGGIARTLFASFIRTRQMTSRLLSMAGGLAVLRGLTQRDDAGPERDKSALFVVRHLQASFERLIESGETDQRLRTQVDLGLSLLRGLLVDGLVVPPRDFHALDHESLRQWFRRHGAHEETLASPLLQGLHSAIYSGGLEIAAGTGIHGLLRIACTYKGAILWKMRAGMGETIFAPLYEALRHRGVHFEFFHAVEALELSADRQRIDRIRVAVQSRAKDYHPLIEVNGLPVWPAEPRFEQLDGPRDVDFEDWWSGAEPVERKVLQDGRDFDEVVLGISVAALKELCGELIHDPSNPRFGQMVNGIATTATQSAQLWMSPTLRQLGWSTCPSPVVIPYRAAMDTWADMPHLIARESWPEHRRPGSCAYLTGSMADTEPVPPRGRNDYPQRLRARVKTSTHQWLTEHVRPVWPDATSTHDPHQVKWHWLSDPLDRVGPSRLDAQWIAPLSNPSNRYVLSLPGTTQHRLRPHESGYQNLTLAGDWTRNAINGGCFEAAVLSGIDAARVLDEGVREGIGDWLGRLEQARGERRTTGKPAPTRAEFPALPVSEAQRPREATVAPHRALPRYALRDGELLAVPPVRLEIDVTTFVLEADPAKLEALLDHQLNQQPDRVVYRPLGAMAIFYCARVDTYAVTDPMGFVPELDFGFWVPALAGRYERGKFVPERAVTFNPYLWVSNDVALTNGRSIFGFAKDLGTDFGIPDDAAPDRPWSVDAWVLPKAGAKAPIERRRLVEVSHPPLGSTRSATRSVADAMALVARSLAKRPEDEARDAAWRAGGILMDAMPRGQRMVFLKQVPDAVDTRRACYQAVVEAQIAFEQTPSVEILDGQHTLTVSEYDSHHPATTLGLVSTSPAPRTHVCAPILSARARFSAMLERPTVIWERP